MTEWVEFNPTMICQSTSLSPQPEIGGRYTGCSYCYAAAGMPHSPEEVITFKDKELSTDQIERFIDQVADLGVKRMCWLGGEPQTRTDFNEIIDYACNKIELVQLATNGIGTKRHVDALLRIPLLEISIDSNNIGAAAKTRPLYQVKAALESVDLLYKQHPFLCINTVVTPQVLPELWNFVDWAFRERNIKKINLYPLLNENIEQLRITKAQADSIIQTAEEKYTVVTENYCKSGKHVVVNADGSIIPCAAFLGTDVVLGTVADLRKAVNNPLMSKFREYDFKSVAPTNVYSFETSNCPGKQLFDSSWVEPVVRKSHDEEDGNELYCMRCSMKHENETENCEHCNFNHFDNKPLGMVCGCFSVLNPQYFSE